MRVQSEFDSGSTDCAGFSSEDARRPAETNRLIASPLLRIRFANDHVSIASTSEAVIMMGIR